jgi:hypothetical protein
VYLLLVLAKSQLRKSRIKESFKLRSENNIFGTVQYGAPKNNEPNECGLQQLELEDTRIMVKCVDSRGESLKTPQQLGSGSRPTERPGAQDRACAWK